MGRSDGEIIARVLAGDGDCFDELVQRHSGPIWSALAGVLANREDARELFQETWLRAFARLASLRDPAHLRSWLVSIALNLSRERLRRSVRTALDPADCLLAGAEVAGEALEQAELIDWMRAEIARLPARQREVVRMRVSEELSYADIARALAIREDNARANYYQGMRRLRERYRILVDSGDDPG